MDLRRLNQPGVSGVHACAGPQVIQVVGPPLASGQIEAETPV
jgi:hypothetical protein